ALQLEFAYDTRRELPSVGGRQILLGEELLHRHPRPRRLVGDQTILLRRGDRDMHLPCLLLQDLLSDQPAEDLASREPAHLVRLAFDEVLERWVRTHAV